MEGFPLHQTTFHPWLRASLISACCTLLMAIFLSAEAQLPGDDTPPTSDTVIETDATRPSDTAIAERLSAIFAEIDALSGVNVTVREGVVWLDGMVPNDASAERAEALALRLDGVVTVESDIERSRAISTNVSPIVAQTESVLTDLLRGLPLIGIAFAVFFVIALIGHLWASWNSFWSRILPNPFLVELVTQAVRIIALVIALITALNIIGATALMGAILGGAGVLGLAIGFAVRDGLENYISSVMLSIRQPFRANEHVVIDGQEGKVVRLTSRATVLMTMDGNHLRIPNATVFKAVILNYTRNPERRFSFELGVDANDDPLAAIKTGVDTLKSLDFILPEPEPFAAMQKVGDSNIVLGFYAWLNQADTDFLKARGVAIARTKNALEKGGFSLPEPIYRLRVETETGLTLPPASEKQAEPKAPPPAPVTPRMSVQEAGLDDVSPDRHLDEKVSEERAEQGEPDLLDEERPVE